MRKSLHLNKLTRHSERKLCCLLRIKKKKKQVEDINFVNILEKKFGAKQRGVSRCPWLRGFQMKL